MKIAVCVKHVPEGHGRIDPGSKRLDRSGEGALNHFDANAVEEALDVRLAAEVTTDRRRAQFGRERRETVLVASDQRECGAGACQGDGHGSSNAARGARHERVTAA